jgi:hypothetical protein
MKRRYLLLCAAFLTLTLAGCQIRGMAAATPAPQASSVVLTPSPSMPGALQSSRTYSVRGDVGTLVVNDKIGSVTVIGRQQPGVSVFADATYESTPPVITRTVSGGTLTVGYTCPAGTTCAVTFVIWVPSDTVVRAATSTGSIWLKTLAGAATAQVGAGSIYVSGLTVPSASLSTDAGWITAAFTSPPNQLTASTLLGTIRIQVPANVTYNVITNAVGGQATVSVPVAATATPTITASTNLGNVFVTPNQLFTGTALLTPSRRAFVAA